MRYHKVARLRNMALFEVALAISSIPILVWNSLLDFISKLDQLANNVLQLWAVQERFKGTMEEINQELSLLRQHYSVLEEQLSVVRLEEQ